MTAAGVVLAALGGLAIGSFLNVVVWRLPRGESLLHPRSHCPGCDALIKPYDNIPVRLVAACCAGAAAAAASRSRARYPLTEALTAALYVAVVVARRTTRRGIVLGLVLVTLLVPIASDRLRPPDHPQRAMTGPARSPRWSIADRARPRLPRPSS